MENNEFKIAQQVAELRGIVVEGFRGIHFRQDISNGRIGKCEIRLTELERAGDRQDGQRKGDEKTRRIFKDWWGVVATIISTVVAIWAVLHH